MIAHKFLSTGAVGLYSGFSWPRPRNGEPGAWVEVEGPLVAGSNGVHACVETDLVNWIDDELWLVELDGPIEEREGVVLGRRGRLVRRVEGWDPKTARTFTESCVLRARDAAVDALSRSGDEEGAQVLAAIHDFQALQTWAAAAARDASGFAADSLAYVADAVELAHGGRPERYGFRPEASATPTPGALAANLGFVVAHAVGCAHAGAMGDPAAYQAGVDAERARQLAWLRERVGLDAAAY